MGLGGCQLVGELVQFGSYKGLGVEEAVLSLWVQTLVPASSMCVLRLRDRRAWTGRRSRYLSRWRSEGGGNSPCGNGDRA